MPAEASPAAAIAAVPPQRTGAAVVRRSARNYKGKWPNFWCRVVMLTFKLQLDSSRQWLDDADCSGGRDRHRQPELRL